MPEVRYAGDQLYDFLYTYDFDSWLLNAVKNIHYSKKRGLLEFIMRLHTGESLESVTPNWDWTQRQALGQRVLRDMAQCLIDACNTNPTSYSDKTKSLVFEMQRILELDGYIYSNGVLLVPEESFLAEKEEEGVLESLIHTLNLSEPAVLKHHMELSATHYYESKWDDSISNSRKVLEGVLQQVANRHSEVTTGQSLEPGIYEKPVKVREYLRKVDLLEKKEEEAVAKVYGLLSNTGGHPYIAQQDQARLMRHLSLTFSQFVLLRLKGALASANAY